jgi:hypothetical protein
MKKKESKKKPFHNEEFSLMMKTFRLALKVPARTMSEICGLGENGWRLYEKDNSNISRAKKNIIRSACTPRGFWHLLFYSSLSDRKKENLRDKARPMLLELETQFAEYKSSIDRNYWRKFL